MRIIKKQIDKEYLEFFTAYCEALRSVSNDEWDFQHVSDAISYTLGFYAIDFHMHGVIPERFEKAEYLFDDEAGYMIPPDGCWISKSGRFSCHRLHGLIGRQAFILWDLKRRVVLPIIFHDLEGIDKENGVIFCRTMSPIHRHGYSSPMQINSEWIDILKYCISIPSEYPVGKASSLSDEEFYEIACATIVPLRNENDVLNCIEFPDLEGLSKKNIRLLDQVDMSNKEKKNLAGEILFHPEFYVKSEDWVFDALFTYSEDMEKCHSIATWFGFEDVVKEAYDEWRDEMKREVERNEQNAARRNLHRDIDEQDLDLPF